MLRDRFTRRDAAHDETAAIAWHPSLYYALVARKRRRVPWRGPRYLVPRERARQYASLIALLRLVAEANAPLPDGLEAAAIEYRRHMSAWSRGRAVEILRGFLLPLLFFLALFMALNETWNAPTLFFGALCLLATLAAILRLFLIGRFDAVLLRLRDDLRAGLQLSEAMRRMDRVFPPAAAERVAAAEATGAFAAVLAALDRESVESLAASRIRGVSGLYVIAVLLAIAAAAAFCLVRVVPEIEEILREFGQSPPWSMRLLIAVGDYVVYRRHLFALAAIFAVLLFTGLVAPRRGGRLIRMGHALAQLLPPLSFVARPRALSRIASLLATCLRAGMPLPRALDMAAAGEVHGVYHRALSRVRDRIAQGTEVSDAFGTQPRCFPVGFRLRLRLGEQSGLLPEALDRLAEVYRRRAERAAQYLAVLLQASAVALMGVLVFVVWSACMTALAAIADGIAGDL